MEDISISSESFDAIFIQHIFPSYKRGLIKEMHRICPDIRFAGSFKGTLNSGIDQMDEHEFYGKQINFPPIYFRNRLVFQSGCVSLVLNNDFDVYIFEGNPNYISTWIAALLAKSFGKKVLFWSIGWHTDEKGIANWIRTAFFRIPDTFLVYGEFGKQMALKRGITNVRMIYNSLDIEVQKELRNRPLQSIADFGVNFYKNDSPILVCVSRLTVKRRCDLLLKATKKMLDEGQEVNLLLVGDGVEKENLIDLSQELGLDKNICFYGACYDEYIVSQLLRNSTLTVAPGMVGLTAMQSLTYGVPVITHSSPDKQSPESDAILDGLNGGLFEYDNIDDLVSVIKQWIDKIQFEDADFIKNKCYKLIDEFYNPQKQIQVLREAINIC